MQWQKKPKGKSGKAEVNNGWMTRAKAAEREAAKAEAGSV